MHISLQWVWHFNSSVLKCNEHIIYLFMHFDICLMTNFKNEFLIVRLRIQFLNFSKNKFRDNNFGFIIFSLILHDKLPTNLPYIPFGKPLFSDVLVEIKANYISR